MQYYRKHIHKLAIGLIVIAGVGSIIATAGFSNSSKFSSACISIQKKNVRTGSAVMLDARCSSVPAGESLVVNWTMESRPQGSNAFVADDGHIKAFFIADVDGEYVMKLSTSALSEQGSPEEEDTDSVHVTATTGNARPDAEAGAYKTVASGDTVLLHGRGYDADGDALTYSWRLVEGNTPAVLSDETTATPSFAATSTGDYTLELTVNDGIISSEPDNAYIHVNSVSTSQPMAIAGPDQFVSTGSRVELDGGASYSVYGEPLTYSWRMLYSPLGTLATLSDTAAVETGFTADYAGDYLASLDVNNGIQASVSYLDDVNEDKVVITAGDNRRPVANGGSDQDVVTGATATLDGSASSDPEGATLRYRWSVIKKPAGSAADVSVFDAQSTQIITDRNGYYLVSLVTNDGQIDSFPDIVRISASGGAPVYVPLNIITGLPYVPAIPESATLLQVADGSGDTVRLSSSEELPLAGYSTVMLLFPDGPGSVGFAGESGWTIVSPAQLPISDASTPTFIAKRDADGMYFKFIMDFTTLATTVQVDALQAWRCGVVLGNCY